MKNSLSHILVILLSLIFIGCSSKKDVISSINNLPKWVLHTDNKDNIYSAIGISKFSKHGLYTMLSLAEIDARSKLAGQIERRISQIQSKAIRYTNISELDEVETVYKQTTKEIIDNIILNRTQRTNFHLADDGTLYIKLVMLKKEDKPTLEKISEKYKDQIRRSEISRENINKAIKVLDNMVSELDKELNKKN